MIIDTHQHFWKYNPNQFSWITDDMRVLQRDFEPAHIVASMRQNQVWGAIAIQARQAEEETDYLIKLAQECSDIKGVIGWVDLCDEQVGVHLEEISQHSIVKGFRHILQEEPKDFMLQPKFLKGMEVLQEQKYLYEILIREDQLEEVYKLVKKFPYLKFCVNHMAKPQVSYPPSSSWKAGIRNLSQLPNVYCKISGIVTEAAYYNWSTQHIRPYMDLLLQSFGPYRLMIGSDWPVCLLAAEYDQVLSLKNELLRQLSNIEIARIQEENALEFYKISR